MNKRRIITHIAVWAGLFITTSIILMPAVLPAYALMRAAALTLMTMVVHYSNLFLFTRFERPSKTTKYFLVVIPMIVMFSIVRYFIETYILPEGTKPFLQYPMYRPMFFVAGTIAVWFISYIVLYAQSLAARERNVLQIINSHNEAKLQYLQSQINPHFLFNAMNNIYSLTLTKSDKAAEMILALTEILRFTVYQKAKEKVAVGDEAQQIDFLIRLFQLKSDEPYNIAFTSNFGNEMIEPMILIPIAENCLKHCDFDLNPNAYTKMHLTASNNFIKFKTENTYQQPKSQLEHSGIGLINLQERLQLLYGSNYELRISKEDKLFTVELTLQWTNQ